MGGNPCSGVRGLGVAWGAHVWSSPFTTTGCSKDPDSEMPVCQQRAVFGSESSYSHCFLFTLHFRNTNLPDSPRAHDFSPELYLE